MAPHAMEDSFSCIVLMFPSYFQTEPKSTKPTSVANETNIFIENIKHKMNPEIIDLIRQISPRHITFLL